LGTVPLRVVDGYPLLKVSSGRPKLAKPKQSVPEGMISVYEEHRLLYTLCQPEELLC
jgi:hypothetical protein